MAVRRSQCGLAETDGPRLRLPGGRRNGIGPSELKKQMRLSRKGDYGIRALVDLAQHRGRGPIPSSAIAARQGIPKSLVGQVLGALRLGGFVRSMRGAQGGHELAMEPAEIHMDAVVESLDGNISVGACLDNPNLDCTGSAGQLHMWEDVRDAIVDVLHDRTLADLAERDTVTAAGRYSI